MPSAFTRTDGSFYYLLPPSQGGPGWVFSFREGWGGSLWCVFVVCLYTVGPLISCFLFFPRFQKKKTTAATTASRQMLTSGR